MLRELRDQPLSELPASIRIGDSHVRSLVQSAISKISTSDDLVKAAEQAYAAWLGFYNSNLKKCGWDKPHLVTMANIFSAVIGLKEVPYLEKKTVGKMGLKGVPGLRVR